MAGVPIPPSIGIIANATTPGWTIRGVIPPDRQFIFQTSQTGASAPSAAEVRTFSDANGVCIALPRYDGVTIGPRSTVLADGVICLSRTTSKVCFWDNQMASRPDPVTFLAGTVVPIGLDPAGGIYQAGGEELQDLVGGVCTDCHAGENPFVIHPDVVLSTGITMGSLVPIRFAPNRYDPIVKASWPQNQLSHNLAYVPGTCSGCHNAAGTGGRLPHLSFPDPPPMPPATLSGYCGTILRTAVEGRPAGTVPPPTPTILATMPKGRPPLVPDTPEYREYADFFAQCRTLASAAPSDRGDPHIATAGGQPYDFQAAGEFIALRNTDTGFELQTRQTPVQTSFNPGPDRYIGLASCAALNTAVALRIGKHRISYQPGKSANAEGMELRIDGKPVTLARRGIDLGPGTLSAVASPGGGFDVRMDDGTHVVVTPEHWVSEGYWYLNVEVTGTPAREGLMGLITASDWLPKAPDGASFGAMPAGLPARHNVLNRRFADAWRVKPATSLFDYAAGTSTASFTDRNWPPKPGTSCVVTSGVPAIPGPNQPPLKGVKPAVAQKICAEIEDKAAYRECVFDATVMGDPALGAAYRRTLARRAAM
jgi:hypothetical protein